MQLYKYYGMIESSEGWTTPKKAHVASDRRPWLNTLFSRRFTVRSGAEIDGTLARGKLYKEIWATIVAGLRPVWA